jgi:hypothetical protein
MQKSFRYSDRRGLPGGPNEESSFGEGFIVSERGQWDYPGMNTLVPTDGNITMQGVPYPVMAQPLYPDWAQPAVGPATMMYPDQDYYFPGAVAVAETPMARYGGGLTKYQKKGEVSTEEKPKVIPEIQISAAESDRRKAEREYDKRRLDFIQSKMQDYIRSQGQFGKNWGLSMQNFPEHEMMNYANEFDYKENTKSAEQIAKNKGYNLKDRASYVDKLTPTERNIIANSQYGANLQPSVWARTAGGLQELGNTLLPGQPFDFNVQGLTPKEQKEMRESSLSAFEVFAPLEVPGNIVANYAKNRGLSTGSNYAQLPSALSGQRMANVTTGDVMALNPLMYTLDAPGLLMGIPSIASGIYKGGKAIGNLMRGSNVTPEVVGAVNIADNAAAATRGAINPRQSINEYRSVVMDAAKFPERYADDAVLSRLSEEELLNIADDLQRYRDDLESGARFYEGDLRDLVPQSYIRYDEVQPIAKPPGFADDVMDNFIANNTGPSTLLEPPPQFVSINVPTSVNADRIGSINLRRPTATNTAGLPPPPPDIIGNALFNSPQNIDISSPLQATTARITSFLNNPNLILKNVDYSNLTTSTSVSDRIAKAMENAYKGIINTAKNTNKGLGKLADQIMLPQPKLEDIVSIANKNLREGVGVAKTKNNIVLESVENAPDVVNVYINGRNTGYLRLPTTTQERTLTDILKGKPYQIKPFENSPIPGLRKASDWPFQNVPNAEQGAFFGQGISGEINKALSEALKSQGSRLYSGATGHTILGANRYENLLRKGLVEKIGDDLFMYKQMGGPQYESDEQFPMGTMNVNIQDIPDDVLAIMIANNR